MDYQFKTITKQSEGFFKDRGSKFFSYAFPVNNENEIQEIQKKLRKKHFAARHHVYAFRLGADKKIFRASDDGEPSNSSGPPILGQIRSFDLTNILIIVVRYFGGTKLGVPGLINAYRTAALDAINNNKIITQTVEELITIKFEYSKMNDIMRIIKKEKLNILKSHFDNSCVIELKIPKNDIERIMQQFSKYK